HTRSKRDWSSDVCSSDLPRNSANYSSSSRLAIAADPPPTLATDFGSGTLNSHHHGAGGHQGDPDHALNRQRVARHSHEPEVVDRSEERRVGEVWRWWRAP